jgi:glycosyltransferase involved in cell wall biosynthesis
VIQFKEKILKLLGDENIRAHVKEFAANFLEKFSIKSNIKQLEAIYKATINYNKFMFREIIKKE